MERRFINGSTISIVGYNHVFVVEIMDKYGRRIDYGTPCFSLAKAKLMLQDAIMYVKKGAN